jgi:hypothetical protein
MVSSAKSRISGRRVHRLFQGFRQGVSRSVEFQFVNFIWWVAFVLDEVLSDRSNYLSESIQCHSGVPDIKGLLTGHWTSSNM